MEWKMIFIVMRIDNLYFNVFRWHPSIKMAWAVKNFRYSCYYSRERERERGNDWRIKKKRCHLRKAKPSRGVIHLCACVQLEMVIGGAGHTFFFVACTQLNSLYFSLPVYLSFGVLVHLSGYFWAHATWVAMNQPFFNLLPHRLQPLHGGSGEILRGTMHSQKYEAGQNFHGQLFPGFVLGQECGGARSHSFQHAGSSLCSSRWWLV